MGSKKLYDVKKNTNKRKKSQCHQRNGEALKNPTVSIYNELFQPKREGFKYRHNSRNSVIISLLRHWKAVNGANTIIQAGYQAFNFGVGLTSSVLGAGGGSVGAIDFAADMANTMQQVKQAQMTPPQAKGNVASGDINLSAGETGFTFKKMSIRAEFARQIDEYLSAAGYKVNLMKVPNITGRTNWNYVRTKGCNIIGDVPQGDMQEIKGMFNRGITIWHNPSTFMDYSQNNAIV